MDWRFWLTWALASSLVSGLAFAIAFIPAGYVGLLFAMPLAAVIVGATVGVAVGAAQSYILPWPALLRQRWLRRSVVGWTAGMTLGLIVALAVDAYRFPRGGPSSFPSSSWMLETAAPITGLVLGLVLWRVLPASSRVSLPLWLIGHTVAVSSGWIAGRLLPGAASPIGLPILALILGPLCYGVISASIMVVVVRNQPILSTGEPADSDVEMS